MRIQKKVFNFAPVKGKMLEWLKRHVWKACDRPKRFQGSNPCLSALCNECRRRTQCGVCFEGPRRMSLLM